MKKIISGKRYDTDTAEEIAALDNGGYGDCVETLYKTKKGAYFLYENGGTTGGSITPMTRDQAAEWCEENGSTEARETEFADSVEDA